MPNQRNQDILGELHNSLAGTNSFFLVNYQGLTSQMLGNLRKDIRQAGAKMVVAKNTLINLALTKKGFDFKDILNGPTAIVFLGDDPVAPAKSLVEFAKKNDKGIPEAKGGVLDGAVIDAGRLGQIASLPSRPELYAELLGVLQAAPSNLVSTLQAKLQEFVGILDAKIQKE